MYAISGDSDQRPTRVTPRSKSEVLDHLRRELRASEFREGLLRRRLDEINKALAPHNLVISGGLYGPPSVSLVPAPVSGGCPGGPPLSDCVQRSPRWDP
jgi:hypothetical protein